MVSLRIDRVKSRGRLLAAVAASVLAIVALVHACLERLPSDIFLQDRCVCEAAAGQLPCAAWDFKRHGTSLRLQLPPISRYHRYVLVEATLVQRLGATAPATAVIAVDRRFTSEQLPALGAARLALEAACTPRSQECVHFTALYVPQLAADNITASLNLTLAPGTSLDIFEGLHITVKTGNPDFVKTITSAKYFVFFLSLLTGYVYYRQWKMIPINLRVVEQELILRQSVLLLLFNDPLFGMIYYRPNTLHIFFTSVATVVYYTHLLYLWLVIFERIYVENSQRANNTSQLWKKVLVTLLFAVCWLEFTMNTTMFCFDPGYQVDESYKPFVAVVKLLSTFLLGVCLMLAGIFAFRVYIYWPTLIDRHKNHFAISAVFFAVSVYHLVRHSERSLADSGQWVVINSLVTNLYLLAEQYLFSVSPEGVADMQNARYLDSKSPASPKRELQSPKTYEAVRTAGDPDDDFDDDLKPEN